MGKQSKKMGSKGYVNNHNPNPKAHDSDERRLERVKSIQVNRLSKIADRLTNRLSSYIPEEEIIAKKNEVIDKRYVLKGAARPAQEYYRPPGYKEDVQPVNIFNEYKNRLGQHTIGLELLKTKLELGINLHNITNKTRQAIETFKEILTLDHSDPLVSNIHRPLIYTRFVQMSVTYNMFTCIHTS